jgi:TPR repeat protein
MTRPSLRIQASTFFLILLTFGCQRKDGAATDSVALLLHSRDRIAVYDAGVDAYRRKEYRTARELWQRALELGDHNAASNLGFLFYYGLGGAADSSRGIAYWQQAMAQGDAEAHRHVAQAIVDGDRRLGSTIEAYGHAVAARALALRASELDGKGVAQDAEILIANIGSGLSSVEKAAGDSLAHLWTMQQAVRR